MGFVDFAIDLAAVLSASRGVASKHVALRGRQLDRYSQTSSVAAVLRRSNRPQPVWGEKAPGTGEETSAAAHDSSTAVPRAEASATRAENVVTGGPVHGSGQSVAREIPTAAGVVRDQDIASVDSAGRQRSEGSEAVEKSRERQNEPVATVSTLKHVRGKEEKDAVVGRPSQAAAEDLGTTDAEPIPEGVNLDLFRTSRGSRLSPLWKGDKQGGVEKPTTTAGGVDLGVFRTDRGSSILRELKQKPTVNRPTPTDPAGLFTAAKPTSPPPAVETLADSAVDKRARARESQRETEEVEVPHYTHPALEDPKPDSTPTTRSEKPVSKEDASELGEMLGAAAAAPKYELRESKVPSSRLGRIWNYGGLAAGMFAGTITESFSRVLGGGGEGSLMLSPANLERLVAKLSKMRGAALKIGQMLSFQDSKMLPGPIQEVLQRVQDRADYMPAWQRDRVLAANLGAEWRSLFEEFEEKPIAAASIGQVHRATLKSNGARVAVKIQFPGVADSINSDLDNLSILLTATKLLPKGLYLNKTIDNARTELGWECDYERELRCAQRYRDLLAAEDDIFLVPKIYPEASGKQVLTMEFMDGVGVTRVKSFTQEQRDWIGTQILRLCLREITEFHFMQTDPNWTNFLYNAERDRLVLLDFGASREYPERFITMYVQLLAAASRSDRDGVKTLSEALGYLTGHESRAMLDAHIASVLTLAEPFLESAPEVYDFRDQTITERVKELIPVMIRERLAPPPEETYSLHRKLSGAFLLCARLGSRVRCREMFAQSVAKSGVMDKTVLDADKM